MHDVSRSQDKLDLLKETYTKIFKSTDPFLEMFQSNIEEKVLLYPTYGTYLEKDQFDALMTAISSTNDLKFAISEVEGNDPFLIPASTDRQLYVSKHLIFDTPPSYEEYREHTIVLDNAIYSLNGNWGMLISNEDHAILGGSRVFVREFKKHYPEWAENLVAFRTMCEDDRKTYGNEHPWLEGLIRHIQS